MIDENILTSSSSSRTTFIVSLSIFTANNEIIQGTISNEVFHPANTRHQIKIGSMFSVCWAVTKIDISLYHVYALYKSDHYLKKNSYTSQPYDKNSDRKNRYSISLLHFGDFYRWHYNFQIWTYISEPWSSLNCNQSVWLLIILTIVLRFWSGFLNVQYKHDKLDSYQVIS